MPPVTVSVYVVAWLPEGLVPVTLTRYVPEAVAWVVARVSVDWPPAVTEAGLRDAVFTVAVAVAPAVTVPEAGAAVTEKSSSGTVVPLVKGAKIRVKSQVFCWIPEQSSAAGPPGQPPLSRWSAQKERVLMPLATAQSYTWAASASVKVSAGPKSSTPGISVTPIMPHSWAGVLAG